MIRYDAIAEIMKAVTEEPVVCNIGHPCQELYEIKDRPQNFYMLGSMGLASSIGLGLALSQSRKVVVIEGDGAVLMNMGALATIAIQKPKNLILVIVDNGSYGSTGFQPTFTKDGLDLADIARAAGIKQSSVIKSKKDIEPQIKKLLASENGPHCVVIKTDPGMPEGVKVIPLSPEEIKNRFMESLAGNKG